MIVGTQNILKMSSRSKQGHKIKNSVTLKKACHGKESNKKNGFVRYGYSANFNNIAII